MKLLRARCSAKLEQVASGSATQGNWPGNRKVRSQIVSEDHRRFPWRRIVGKVRRGRLKQKNSDRTKDRTHRFSVDLRERDGHVVCHASAFALVMTDEGCWGA